MHDLRFYDYEFRLLHICSDVLSAYWILKYNDIGTFEGTFPLQSPVLEVLKKHRYLIVVQGEFQAIVTAYKADKLLTVYGKTPNWILSKKTYPAFDTANMKDLTDRRRTEILKRIVGETFSDVENFKVYALQDAPATSEHFLRKERKSLIETVKEALTEVTLGHRVRLDFSAKTWNFEMYGGEQLPLVLSEGNRNFSQVSVSDDCQRYFNSCWYKKELKDLGEWNAAEELPREWRGNYGSYYTISNNKEETDGSVSAVNSGRYPNGSYLVCVDTDGQWRVMSELPTLEEQVKGNETGLYCWDTSVSSATEKEAEAELLKKKREYKIDGKAVGILYGEDYSLGDILRVQAEKGAFLESCLMRVAGVEVWFESGDVGEKMVLEEVEEV